MVGTETYLVVALLTQLGTLASYFLIFLWYSTIPFYKNKKTDHAFLLLLELAQTPIPYIPNIVKDFTCDKKKRDCGLFILVPVPLHFSASLCIILYSIHVIF
jgi:hypothetical protein